MTWTKLDQDFADRHDLLALDRSTRLLHVEAMVYANRVGSDGLIPRGALPRLTDHEDPAHGAAQLVAHGVWDEVATGWLIVDFLRDQPSREQVDKVKAQAAFRQRRNRQHRDGDHTDCDKRWCHGVTDGVTDGVGHAPPNERSERTNERSKSERERNGGEGSTRHPRSAGGSVASPSETEAERRRIRELANEATLAGLDDHDHDEAGDDDA